MVIKMFRYFFIIIVLSICGYMLLVTSYATSNSVLINNNVKNSGTIFDGVSYGKSPFGSNGDSHLDTVTDEIMISASSIDGSDNPFVYAAKAPYGNSDSYERYWHGYQIVLRPLLTFFYYQTILKIYSIIYVILLFSICILMNKINLNSFVLPFCLSIMTMNLSSIMNCLQYTDVALPTLIFIFIMLLVVNKKQNLDISSSFFNYLFLFLGCVINYFDLLSFPIFSVGMLSVFFIICNKKSSINNKLKYLCINILLWFFGYSLTWIMRWLISSVVLQENVFINAFESASFRLSTKYNGENFSVIYTIFSNIKNVSIPNYFINLFFILFLILTNAKKLFKNLSLSNIFIYFVIALMPFVFWTVLRNHSALHAFMTFRSIAVSFFAFESFLISTIENDKPLNI